MSQREIKFRAWSSKTKIMYKNWTAIAPEVVAGKILMQYTNLKDKNGKEIYQGDRLRFDVPEKGEGTVVYSAPSFILEDTTGGVRYKDLGVYPCEVIGNIYEN